MKNIKRIMMLSCLLPMMSYAQAEDSILPMTKKESIINNVSSMLQNSNLIQEEKDRSVFLSCLLFKDSIQEIPFFKNGKMSYFMTVKDINIDESKEEFNKALSDNCTDGLRSGFDYADSELNREENQVQFIYSGFVYQGVYTAISSVLSIKKEKHVVSFGEKLTGNEFSLYEVSLNLIDGSTVIFYFNDKIKAKEVKEKIMRSM